MIVFGQQTVVFTQHFFHHCGDTKYHTHGLILLSMYADKARPLSPVHTRTVLFGKIQKNTKRGKLLEITYFQSKMLESFTNNESLQRYTLHYQ